MSRSNQSLESPEWFSTVRSYTLRIIPALAGLALFIVLFYRLGPATIMTLLRQAGWGFPLMVLIFGTEEMVRATAVLQSLPRESRPAFRDMLNIRFIGEAVKALTLTGPFLAEPVRAWFIKRQGVRYFEAAAAVLADFAVHSLVAAMLTVGGALYFLNYVNTSKQLRVVVLVLLYGGLGFLTIAASFLYFRLHVIGALVGLLSRIPGLGRLRGKLDGIRQTEDMLFGVTRDRPRMFLRLLLLQFIAHGLLLLEINWGVRSMGIDASFLTTSLAEMLTKVTNASFVGAAEGSYALLFGALGLPAAAGFTLALLKRLRSLVFALVGMGGIALMSLRRARA